MQTDFNVNPSIRVRKPSKIILVHLEWWDVWGGSLRIINFISYLFFQQLHCTEMSVFPPAVTEQGWMDGWKKCKTRTVYLLILAWAVGCGLEVSRKLHGAGGEVPCALCSVWCGFRKEEWLRWNRIGREIGLAGACKTSCMGSSQKLDMFLVISILTILYSSFSDPQLCVQNACFHPSFFSVLLVYHELHYYFLGSLFVSVCSFNLAFWLCSFLHHLHWLTLVVASLQSPFQL